MQAEQLEQVATSGAWQQQSAKRPWTRAFGVLWRFVRRKPLGAIGGTIVVILVITAIFADVIAPYAYDVGSGTDRLQGPSAKHWLGTDNLGRDLFSRIVYGSRISIAVGFGAVIVGTGLATVLGILSGYFGGKFDLILQRIIDAWIAFPALVLLAFLVTVMTSRNTGPKTSVAIVAITLGLVVPALPRALSAAWSSASATCHIWRPRVASARTTQRSSCATSCPTSSPRC